MEKTLILIKPDGVQRALIGEIVATFERVGLKVVAMKMVMPTKELVGEHYMADDAWMISVGKKTRASFESKGIKMKETDLQIGARIRSWLIGYLMESPVVAIVFEGTDAIAIVRKLIGSTAPIKADPSTIRGRYSTDSYENSDSKKRPVRNLVHASEDQKTAEREISVWFTKKEIYEYKRGDESVL